MAINIQMGKPARVWKDADLRIVRGSEKVAVITNWIAAVVLSAVSALIAWHSGINPLHPRLDANAVFFLIVPLSAVIFLLRALWETIRLKRFGDPVLQLATAPIPPGGSVEGRITLGDGFAQAPEFTLTLDCIQRTVEQGPKGNHIREKILWSNEAKSMLLPGGMLNVAMPVPADQPEATQEVSPSGIVWRLTVKAPLRGMAFIEKYNLPVFRELKP